jgi:ribosomal 30S subunit maturation factor RimM
MQDLIGMAVTMKVSGARLGTVIDVYDGTGELSAAAMTLLYN